jgi:hypothetical protein
MMIAIDKKTFKKTGPEFSNFSHLFSHPDSETLLDMIRSVK